MSNLDIQNLTDEQLAQITAEARRRKMEKVRSEKFARFEPTYTDYKKSVVAAKKANDLKKSLLADLKKLGFGKTAPAPASSYPKTKGKGKGSKI
jgi:hypothetical protein